MSSDAANADAPAFYLPRRYRVRSAASLVGGIACGLLALEAALRIVVSPGTPPRPVVERDRVPGPAITVRQISEGIATSRFSRGGARLTGAPVMDGGETILVLGDSYVRAIEVGDAETMGAWVERWARAAGRPVNVRQYGWAGSSPAQYAAVAPQLLGMWQPSAVVVKIGRDDLEADALAGRYPRLRIGADGRPAVDPGPPGFEREPPWYFQHSALGTLAWQRTEKTLRTAPLPLRRWFHLEVPGDFARSRGGPRPAATELARVPSAVVRLLDEAYGPRLVLVYVAWVGLAGNEAPDPVERDFFTACSAHRVRCASTRAPMIEARARGTFGAGFATTTPGEGHLNPAGHRIAASVIWDQLRAPDRDALQVLAR